VVSSITIVILADAVFAILFQNVWALMSGRLPPFAAKPLPSIAEPVIEVVT
jgi:hypothetical protein